MGALGLVIVGYADARPDPGSAAMAARCLHFRARCDSLEEAALACEAIGSYNDFDGHAVAEMLRSLDPVMWERRVSVGREYSPVLYFDYPYGADVAGLCQRLTLLAADEVDAMGQLGVRAWWD